MSEVSVGETYGELTVIEVYQNTFCKCRCSCGAERDVRKCCLVTGHTTTCGNISAHRRDDLTGQVFGEWTVLKFVGNRKYLCRCSCGTEREVYAQGLKRGTSKSCGDRNFHPKARITTGPKAFNDLTGKQFGALTVKRYLGDRKWECICEKGHITTRFWHRLHADTPCVLCEEEKREQVKQDKLHEKELAKQRHQEKLQKRTDAMLSLTVNGLTVIKRLPNDEHGRDHYLCKCSCGAEREIRGYALRNPPFEDAYKCKHSPTVGKRFGKLLVLRRIIKTGTCICLCDCGNTATIETRKILSGVTKSCGCTRAHKYDREGVLHVIKEFEAENGRKPYVKELAESLWMGETATYRYIKDYNLQEYVLSHGSIAQLQLSEMIAKRYEVVTNTRKILGGKELDIYIPELKIDIEFNGDYWHSIEAKGPSFQTYHQEKTLECLKRGIRLIHIFEHEWTNKERRIKIERLLHSLLGDVVKLQEYNVSVVEIPLEEAKSFEEEYHLQGSANSDINIALKHEDTIVAVMAFRKSSNKNEYEMVRLCYKDNIVVTCGTEKMLNYFVDTYSQESIVAYCDITKYSTDEYKAIGFIEEGLTQPQFLLIDKQTHDRADADIDYDEDDSLAFLKVYDSGRVVLRYIPEPII